MTGARPAIWRVTRRGRRYVPVLLGGRFNPGYCPICEGRTIFLEEGPWLRNTYRCLRCQSIPRWRALISVLSECFPDWRSAELYEAGPSGAASRKLERECRRYRSSQYLPGREFGTCVDGVWSEDIENLTFPDESFDFVVTQDVFEHVLRPRLGFSEIARVLRPGGAHVFTVPYYGDRPASVRRAEPAEDGTVRHLLPPDYHRGPVDRGGSLVVTEWGQDLPAFIYEHGRLTTVIHRIRDRRQGIDGEFREVFVSQKPR